MIKFKKIVFSILAVVMVFTPLQVHGAENTQLEYPNEPLTLENVSTSNSAYLYVNGSTMNLTLPEYMDVIFSSPTDIRIINRLTGEIEVLPTQVINFEGIPIAIFYTQTSHGLYIELVPMTRWLQCALGTLGMAGTGVIAGGAAGSAFPGLGTVGVGIAGGIFGAAVGAATFCFR